MKLDSVRTRLTLWNVGVVAFILAGFAGAIHCTVRLSLTNGIDREMIRTSDFLSQVTLARVDFSAPHPRRRMLFPPFPFPRSGGNFPLPHPWPSDRAGFPAGTRWRMLRRIFLQPSISNLFGEPISLISRPQPWVASAFSRTKKGETALENTVLSGVPIRLFSDPILYEGKVVGVVQIVRPLDELNTLLGDLDRTLLTLTLPALIIAGLTGAFLTDKSLRPVRRISQAASELGAKDLSLRLPVKGNDEFADLAKNFNRMTEGLEEAFHDLETAYANLEAAYERHRRFTADASHELRTPLTTIKANTSLALSGSGSLETYREALEEADYAANAMHRIVEDLMFLARSDNNGIRMDVQPLQARRIVQSAIAEIGSHRTGTPIRIDQREPDLSIRGDPHHLKRLFLNLLENAIRHTPPEGIIRVNVLRSGSDVLFRVEDTGEGIAPEHLPRVFDRFYRADPARAREDGGAGLGLSICRSIVRAHGGTIEIESRPGEGATVTVTLPGDGASGRSDSAENEPARSAPGE